MKNTIFGLATFALSFLFNFLTYAEGGTNPASTERYTISGYVKDVASGESLIGASVFVSGLQLGCSTNQYGFYSLSLKPGHYELVYRIVGYTLQKKNINLTANIIINIELGSEDKNLQEVVVTADKPELNIKKTEMSVNKMDIKTIKQIPPLMGEVDLIKAIQLLPGVIPASEGTSSFSVRGGSADQNLVLLDEATVYNASHMLGFFSVFNNDAIKNIKLYKGDIPASSGGRLASLLEVNMKDGNNKKFSGTGGIGLISSRLTLEGPIVKDKSSFIVSGRRTYADLFMKGDNKCYFYDFNAKFNTEINKNNHLFVSGYLGSDIFKAKGASMAFDNSTLTVRWNHLYSQRMFSNLSLMYSKYNYKLQQEDGASNFIWKYNMRDLGAKLDFSYFVTPSFTIKYGLQSVQHAIDPGNFDSSGENDIHSSIPSAYSIESGAYLSFENAISSRFSVKYGVRYSLFQNIGKGTVYNLDSNYDISGKTVYKSGHIYQHYNNFEPRVGLMYEINRFTSIKGSYSRSAQYMQMASTSSAGSPMDLWYTASPNVKPQISDMGALGIFRNLFNEKIEASVEVYYKTMQHVIDFKDHASVYGNTHLETELRFGKAKSYGVEFLAQFPSTKLNGWVSYTYSHTVRQIDAINNGKEYLAPYDKPHTVNVVLSYQLNRKLSLGSTFVYATGAPMTFPAARAQYGNLIYPIYAGRNTYRMPDYHRLDLSLTLQGKEKPGRLWHGEWNFSIYNVYARNNAWYIYFEQDSKNPNRTYAEQVTLFSIIPSITYNFKF